MTRGIQIRISRRLLAGLTALLAVLVLTSACGASTKPGSGGGKTSSATAPSTSGGSTVNVKNFSFEPSSLTVKPGTKVTWKFDDTTKHNVTADKNTFKSTDLAKGGSYSFTFKTAGTYDYICTIHQYMKGSITVK